MPDVRLKLTVAYDGTAFRGWARQPGERTVEGSSRRRSRNVYRDRSELAVAGRTDTGVHALANVVSVEVERRPAARARGRGAERRAAAGRRSRSRVEEAPATSTPAIPRARAPTATGSGAAATRSPFEVHRSLWHPRPLDRQRLDAAAAMIVGEHDFRAFTPDRHAARGLRPRSSRTPAGATTATAVELEITADSFLRHMVRTLVGTMLERDPDEIVDLLQGAPRSRRRLDRAGGGLYLVSRRLRLTCRSGVKRMVALQIDELAVDHPTSPAPWPRCSL